MISAILLAAGESRRMGSQNKLLLPFKGMPIIHHLLHNLLGADIGELIVVVGHESERIMDAIRKFDVQIVENINFREGMSTSIQTGVKATDDSATGYMICLSDLPLITSDEFDAIMYRFREVHQTNPAPIIIPTYQGQRGNPVLFSSTYEQEIFAQRGITGCRGLVRQYPEHIVEVEMATDHVLRDIDTPDGYNLLIADR